jgi:hypothetical protein
MTGEKENTEVEIGAGIVVVAEKGARIGAAGGKISLKIRRNLPRRRQSPKRMGALWAHLLPYKNGYELRVRLSRKR